MGLLIGDSKQAVVESLSGAEERSQVRDMIWNHHKEKLIKAIGLDIIP